MISTGFFEELSAGDPYPVYERLRGQPVHQVNADGLWVVSRYDEVVEVLRQPKLFSSELGMNRLFAGQVGPSAFRGHETSILGVSLRELRLLIASDPPVHSWLRRSVTKAFTPSTVAAIKARVSEICRGLVADMLAKQAAGGGADLVEDLAWPLPVIVIAELLGIPVERRVDFKRWSDALVGGLDGSLRFDEIEGPASELFGFLGELVEARRIDTTDDLVGRLVRLEPEEGDERLGPMEIMLFCMLLLIAGNETTTNLLGNLARCVCHQP